MKEKWKKIKENNYIIHVSENIAIMAFSALVMVMNIVFYFIFTPKWVSGRSQFGPSPQYVPNLLTWAMFICAAVVFVQELIKFLKKKKAKKNEAPVVPAQEKKAGEEGEQTEDYFTEIVAAAKEDKVSFSLIGISYILAAAASVIFYVLCSDFLGFILTIAIIMVFLQLLYGVRKPLTIILTTLVMSVGLYFAATKLLSLVLPVGTLIKSIIY